MMHNWNMVNIIYCDGGSFSGNRETPFLSPNATGAISIEVFRLFLVTVSVTVVGSVLTYSGGRKARVVSWKGATPRSPSRSYDRQGPRQCNGRRCLRLLRWRAGDVANCNINANFLLNFLMNFRLNMQTLMRIAPENDAFPFTNGHLFCNSRYLHCDQWANLTHGYSMDGAEKTVKCLADSGVFLDHQDPLAEADGGASWENPGYSDAMRWVWENQIVDGSGVDQSCVAA